MSVDLVFVGVEVLRVDAPVADDVAVGLGDVTSLAAPVPVVPAAVQQILLAEWNHNSGALDNLSLESPQRTEGPAGPAQTLQKCIRADCYLNEVILTFVPSGAPPHLVLDRTDQALLPPVHSPR